MNNEKLLIIGAGGHGRVVADIAKKMNKWQQIAFLDDDENKKSSMGIKIIGKLNSYIEYINNHDIFVAIGNNKDREKILKQLGSAGANIPILIHPSAIIGEDVMIGIGTAIMAMAAINCCSQIGKGCVINTGATVDHDNNIADYVNISPGTHLAGTVNVGKGTSLGIGSSISNNINIAGNCIIGAGTVVIRDITESGTYVGVPARKIC